MGAVLKQIDAPVGQASVDSLRFATKAALSGTDAADGAYIAADKKDRIPGDAAGRAGRPDVLTARRQPPAHGGHARSGDDAPGACAAGRGARRRTGGLAHTARGGRGAAAPWPRLSHFASSQELVENHQEVRAARGPERKRRPSTETITCAFYEIRARHSKVQK